MPIKADAPAIARYYAMLDEAARQGQTHEGNVRNAFQELLRQTAKDQKGWELITEQTERRETNAVRYDGTLRDSNRLPHGWWEAKDTRDDLDTEIRKKRERGYRFDNIIFEDTREAALYQDNLLVLRVEVRDPAQLADLLNRFYAHEIEPFTKFVEAVAFFQKEIPHIANGLKERIEASHHDNQKFQAAFADFMELCKTALNPNISQAAVDEMLIQHMLSIRLISKIFTEGFTQRNVIAAEIEHVIGSLTSPYFNPTDFLGALDRFYTAIEEAADTLATFSEKQDFINHVYERFFQGYSVKLADTHGIVYTPQPIVDFMCAAVEEVLLTEFGKKLGDDGVYVIDPCTGTGNFAVNLLRRAHATNPRGFEQFYKQQLFANEVMLMPYYIASLNIEHEYYALSGKYEPFEGICFVDTLDLAERGDGQLELTGFMTERNTARVERQKAAPITVILGNPPYNVGQLNENDNNKNRKYDVIDKRIAETYVKESTATLRMQLYDPYVKFFRWASDRLQGRDGIVCFVSNNGFVDGLSFDGFRKHLLQDFTQIFHLDLSGDARTTGERRRQEGGNVFDDKVRVGIGITVAIRSSQQIDQRVSYHRVPDYARKEEKLEYLIRNVELDGKQNALNTIEWSKLTPDQKHTWLIGKHSNEFDTFIAIGSKEAKRAKAREAEAIFKVYSSGVKTNADDFLFDFSPRKLADRIKLMIEDYRTQLGLWALEGKPKNLGGFLKVNEQVHKWIRNTKRTLLRGTDVKFAQEKVRLGIYRPFSKKYYYFERAFNEDIYQMPRIFPTTAAERENRVICTVTEAQIPFSAQITNCIPALHYGGRQTQCFPFYVYDEDGSNRRENITDWALGEFRARYPLPTSPEYRGGVKTPMADDSDKKADSAPLPVFGEGLGVGSIDGEAAKLGVGLNDGSIERWAVTASPKELYDKIKPLAREMRSNPTPAEKHLWQRLRHEQVLGFKFRRQHPIDRFIVDFYCPTARLVIEVDGSIHDEQQEADALRQKYLESLGLQVLRFTNGEVLQQTDGVVERIGEVLQEPIQPQPQPQEVEAPHPQPLPEYREGSRTRKISKWDIFYYVYGLLHHPEYRSKFADNLKRELPRIPFAPDFWAFAEAGRKLADLHLNYETLEPHKLEWVTKEGKPLNFRVEKMKFTKDNDLVYNDTLTLRGIPPAAFDYKLGNRSALHWIVDQYQVSTDKRSGITSDPNRYSDDERYIVNLIERITRVSLETVAIVNRLPPLA